MKYIDAEKLKVKLTKMQFDLNAAYRHPQSDSIVRAISLEYDDIISLVNSLQQEQPDNEDIDKVAQELYEHLYELKRRNSVPTNLYDKQEIIDLWKAGIEYGRNHPKQEQPEVELEKELD